MQAENIEQLNPQGQIQKPLFQTNPDLRLGFIVFNTNKKPINKATQSALKYLSGFYSREYVKDNVNKKFIQNKKSPYSADEIEEIKKDPTSYFPLESVFDYHIHLVSSTLQPFFTLKDAYFKIMVNTPIKNLRQQNLWYVNFIQLKRMNLSNCDLLNIEGLTFCNFPVLEKLQLQDNHINSIQALTKCDFKHLKEISFYNNPLINVKKMMRLQCPKLDKMQIDIESQNRFFERLAIFNRQEKYGSWWIEIVDFMVKLECIESIKELPLKFLYRLQPKWHEETMKKINPQLKIYTEYQEQRRRRQQRLNRQRDGMEDELDIQFLDHAPFIDWQGNGNHNQQARNRRIQLREVRNQRRAENALRRQQQRRQNNQG